MTEIIERRAPERFDFWSTNVRNLDHAELAALKQNLIRHGHAERARILSSLVRAAVGWLRRQRHATAASNTPSTQLT